MYIEMNTATGIDLLLFLAFLLPKKNSVLLVKPMQMAAAKVIPLLKRYKAKAPANKRRKNSAYMLKNVTMNSILFPFFGANIQRKCKRCKGKSLFFLLEIPIIFLPGMKTPDSHEPGVILQKLKKIFKLVT